MTSRVALAAVLFLATSTAGAHAEPAAHETAIKPTIATKPMMKALKRATRGAKLRAALDACWTRPATAQATLTITKGAVTEVALVNPDDPDAGACLTGALRTLSVSRKLTGTATLDLAATAAEVKTAILLTSENKRVLEEIVARNGTQGKIGTGAGTGTGTGIGAGTGTGTSAGASGDFVAGAGTGTGTSTATVTTGPAVDPPAGARDATQIDRVIRPRAGILRACYQKQLAKHPDLAGRVVARIEVDPDGTVTAAAITSSTLGSPDVETCIARQLRRLRFPAATAAATINYPFVFSSQ
jgi:TonB family protein